MTIQVFQPSLGLEELLSVASVFQSNWIGRGKMVKQFEEDFATHLRVSPDNLVSTTSCTEALFQIMQLIGLDGCEVILPSVHFVGAANAVLAHGGIPVLCDVNPCTLNVEARYIEPLITPRTRAIILLHYGGYPCEMSEIMELAKKHGLMVIEDAACSPDSWYNFNWACGTIGDFGVWSFDAMKIISTGDGGMIYAKDPEHIKRLRGWMYLGVDEASGYASDKERWWEFNSFYPGRRAIMNDITAAIGIEQLKKLGEFVGRRATLTAMYESRLKPLPKAGKSSHYFFWIQTDRRDELARYLKENDVYTTFRYYPLHRAMGIACDLPNTEWAAERTLLLPLHQGLDYHDVDYICELVEKFNGQSKKTMA